MLLILYKSRPNLLERKVHYLVIPQLSLLCWPLTLNSSHDKLPVNSLHVLPQ